MSTPYACLRDVKFELKEVLRNTDIENDVQMLQYLRLATRQITLKLGIRFMPHQEALIFNHELWRINSQKGILYLPEPAFSVSQVKNGDGTVLTTSAYTTYPASIAPFGAIRFADCYTCNSWWQSACRYGDSEAAVTGVWGFHYDYANAWTDTGAVLSGAINDNVKVIDIDDVIGDDFYGRAPRLSPGQLIRVVSEDDEDVYEWMEIAKVDEEANTVTVRRGAHGSTATAHADEAIVEVWETNEDIRQATARWAAYPYKRRGQYQTSETDNVTGVTTRFPMTAPGDVAALLQSYANGVPYGRR